MITEGTKVVVLSGDRDTVMFDWAGTVRNIQPNGRCEIDLGACSFYADVSEIAETMEEYDRAMEESQPYASKKSMVVYDWTDRNDHPYEIMRRRQ